jgi:hypothetical protein
MMLRIVAGLLAGPLAAATAVAEPVRLSPAEMDSITAAERHDLLQVFYTLIDTVQHPLGMEVMVILEDDRLDVTVTATASATDSGEETSASATASASTGGSGVSTASARAGVVVVTSD